MTTTNQTEVDTQQETEQTKRQPSNPTSEYERQQWEAYRLQQSRLLCPTCGESCEAIY